MIPSWEGWPTKAKEELSPHEVRLTPLDTKPVFLCLEDFCFLYILDFCYLVSLLGQALTNRVRAYLTYLKSQILQIVGLDYFLTSMLTNFCSYLSVWSNFMKLGIHVLYNNLYVKFVKPTIWRFSSHVLCLHLPKLNLIIVFKINLQWSCLLAFCCPPCKQFKLRWPSMEKLNFKHLNRVFQMFWFYGISNIHGFLFVKINLIL